MSYVPKILIVDDDPRMCDSLKVLLGNEGYEIQTRRNGQEALEALVKNDFDVVLLDFVLPDMNAAEIMDHINSQTPETLVIVITGHASLDSAVDSLKKGASGYLRKPFEHEELSKMVRNALDQKALKSEQKRVEEALRYSEERYHAIFEQAADSIVLVDGETGALVEFNERAHDNLGFSREEFEKLKIPDFEVIESPEEVAKHIEKVINEGADSFETKHRTKGGEIRDIQVSTRAISIRGKNFIQAIWRDISELKRAEKALRESEERYRCITEALTDYVFTVRIEDGHPVETVHSPACVAVTGYAPDEFASEPYLWIRMVHEEDRAAVEEQTRRVLLEQDVEPIEHRILRKDGVMRWVRNAPVLHYDGQGRLLSYDGLIQDITDRKLVEEALRESEEKYRSLVESTEDSIYLVDRKRTYLFMNEKYLSRFDLPLDKVIGRTYAEFHSEEETKDFAERVKEVFETGKSLWYENRSQRDGRYFLRTLSPVKEPDGRTTAVTVISKNITEHKRAREALVRAKEDWENTFDATTDMIMLLDNEHQIFRANRAVAEALNTTKEGLVGKKCYQAIHERSRPIRKCPLELTMKTLEPHTAEIAEPNLGGTFICSTSPILDREGKLTGYTHSLKDITESKRLEAQFQQAQRLEAIGTLAGGIAHDFNNLLMAVQGNVSLMLMDMDSTHPYYERLRNIEKQVQSGARLTSHLLGYARKGKYEVKPFDLNQLVEKTFETFSRTKKEITIHRELAEDLFMVEGDQGQIEQMLFNLYVNGADAMPSGGNLILKTMNTTHNNMMGKVYDPKPGKYVLLTVTDTGIGMDKETVQRIFDPFFTTKEMGRGTGLGLASAYGIIKGHGGYIDVESKKGQGATFSIYLPATEKKVREAVKTADGIMKATGTVLLVDDEDDVLEVDQELLEAMGYRVLIARDGKEAIEVYEKNRDDIEIVVLDMVMPVMGGGEAYDRMKEINPNVKVLLSSGYSIDGQAKEILKRGCDGFIQKPFSIQKLSQKIREVLEKK